MAIKFTNRQCGDDYYFVDKIQNLISDYDLSGMSNKTLNSIPNVDLSNAIALLFASEMSGDGQADTSILPYIGVEILNEVEKTSGQILGSGHKTQKITTGLINSIKAIQMKDRFSMGLFISNDQITELEAILVEKPDLYAETNLVFMDMDVAITIWATSKQHVRLVSDVVRSIIQYSKVDLSDRGVKNITISKSGSLYNFDFSQALYGSEIKLRYMNVVTDFFVNESIEKINRIELDSKFVKKNGEDELERTVSVGVSQNEE